MPRLFFRWLGPIVASVVLAATSSTGLATSAMADNGSAPQGFGPNVVVFDPSMPTSQIQATVDAIASKQLSNQFGTERYALLFKPGTYGSKTKPLNFQLGYYTSVAGLGLSPGDVVINGSIDVYNQCVPGFCVALNNFWRSLSNLTINVTKPAGCRSREFWAVSQAAPMRRVHIKGETTLMDYCTGPSYASGGFIADSAFDGLIVNGSQQQWITRNSKLDGQANGWTNGVWNQVFSGVVGAPAQCFPAQKSCGPYTTLPTSPVTREAPFLYVDAAGKYNVFVPAVQHDSAGTTWSGSGQTPGTSIPLDRFFVARPADSALTISQQLDRGKNLILTPGVYDLDKTLHVARPDTIVLGLGLPTLVPEGGIVPMKVTAGHGVDLSGMILDAGPQNSPTLLQVGNDRESDSGDPSALQDVFFRIGGATPGKAEASLVVNSDNTILDDVWAWRADHGNGVGWTSNTADTGVVVNGDNVAAYGLFVEHYQKYDVIWNGNRGTDVFFQNEMPYDPPSQAAWMETPGVDGWAALKVNDGVSQFAGYGMGSYSFFNQGIDIFAKRAFEVPTTLPAGSLHDLLTIFLDPTHGSGGILHVINETGGSSTQANPDTPVTVVSYP
ncbi:MAG TPA: adenylyl cyclase [Candidatus Dormibacteraeota bacterium]|nr:adenylyl cyclase [Candidatus Dormibacteraeota bacterium]